jgi:hypothetical protein
MDSQMTLCLLHDDCQQCLGEVVGRSASPCCNLPLCLARHQRKLNAVEDLGKGEISISAIETHSKLEDGEKMMRR